jgi:hypothetical protein
MKILLSAITKTIKVIANSPMAMVRLEYYLESFDQYYIICVAKVQEKKYGRALELLNASIKDKTFDGNMSRIIKVPLNMSVGNWSAYSWVDQPPYVYNYTSGAYLSEEESELDSKANCK